MAAYDSKFGNGRLVRYLMLVPMLLVLLIATVVFSGCDLLGLGGDDTEFEDDPDPEDPPEAMVLGRGYDVFDPYAHPLYIKEAVLDYTALYDAGKVENVTVESSEFRTISGSTYEEYSSDMSSEISLEGSYKYFSGSLKSSFSESRFSSTEYQYASVQARIAKKARAVVGRADIAGLKGYLTPEFSAAVNDSSVPPETLFARFGTHVMTGVILGARLDYNISAKTVSSSGSESISAYAESSFKSLFSSASASFATKENSYWASYFSETEVKTTVLGGSSEEGMGIHSDGEYGAWIASIGDNPVFCDFYTGSLVEIWDLAESAERSAEIAAAFDTWAETRSVNIDTVSPAGTAVIDILFRGSGYGETLDHNGRTYYRIDQDLNEGAGGDDIFMYVAYGKDDGSSGLEPITHIGFVYDDDEGDAKNDCADHYSLINYDLNGGAGGDFIYLVYYRGGSRFAPIRNLYTHNSSDGDRQYPSGHNASQVPGIGYYICYRMQDKNWTGTSADLNKQAGGDYIYMYVGR